MNIICCDEMNNIINDTMDNLSQHKSSMRYLIQKEFNLPFSECQLTAKALINNIMIENSDLNLVRLYVCIVWASASWDLMAGIPIISMNEESNSINAKRLFHLEVKYSLNSIKSKVVQLVDDLLEAFQNNEENILSINTKLENLIAERKAIGEI